MLKIATTETYDPTLCIDLWYNRASEFDFLLYITKRMNAAVTKIFTNPDSLWNHAVKPSIIHVTCTGWGGSELEPSVQTTAQTVKEVEKLIDFGYPIDRIVWRCDPIIPTKTGLEKFKESVAAASELKIKRVRSSILQMYKHSLERMTDFEVCREITDMYSGGFFPKNFSQNEINAISEVVRQYRDISFESCASLKLSQCGFSTNGCMSEKDLIINGIDPETSGLLKGNQRQNCSCLLKHQLIPGGFSRGRCPHGCLYCYIKDNQTSKPIKSHQLI